MHRGYVKLWRRLKDADFWASEKFSRPQAWVDLVMLANFKDTFFRVRGQRVDVKRGQLAYSEVTLSERWKWSRGKIRRFLKELESETEQKIEQQKNNITTLITIINYELYQGDNTANGTTDDTPDGTPNSTTDGTHLKNVKNVKNVKKRDRESVTLPEWIDSETWKDFQEFRIRIKAPLTNRAIKNLILELEKLRAEGQDANACINQSITRGWRGVFAIKNNYSKDPMEGWGKL